MGTAGVLLILKPGQAGFSLFQMLPVLSGASYAVGSIITYRYLADESPMAILMSFFVAIGFCGGLVASSFALFPVPDALRTQAPFLFSGWQSVGTDFWFWILVIAVGASLALSLMTSAYQIAKPAMRLFTNMPTFCLQVFLVGCSGISRQISSALPA